MPQTIDRNGAHALDTDIGRRHGGPVVLATFEDAPFDPQAARLAVESAADMRSTLFVVDVLEVRSARHAARRGGAPLAPAHADAFRAVEEHAADLGVTVDAARMPSRQPVADLVEFVEFRRPALVVLATDPSVLRRFRRPTHSRYRELTRALAQQARCLVWTAQPPNAAAATARPKRVRRRNPWALHSTRPVAAAALRGPGGRRFAMADANLT
jgi:hypothetical protein